MRSNCLIFAEAGTTLGPTSCGAADTAQKLGSVDTSKQSALTDVTRAFSGYT